MFSLSCKLALAGSSRGVAAALSQFEFQAQHAVAGQHSIQPPPALATGPARLNSPALDLCWHVSQQHNSLAAELFLPSSPGLTHAVHALPLLSQDQTKSVLLLRLDMLQLVGPSHRLLRVGV